ncbi:MAG TPA: hypothetical protein VGO11_19840 [Chthoniobacteraceae bacterium]|jgi:hypothetical protein|nr:hypothetical protein [Chthoniobacteraceae bacterium]
MNEAMLDLIRGLASLGDRAPSRRPRKVRPGTCAECGCTDARACAGGCSWVNEQRTVCSSCLERVTAAHFGVELAEALKHSSVPLLLVWLQQVRLVESLVVRRLAEHQVAARGRLVRILKSPDA